MATGSIAVIPRFQFSDALGWPLVGGSLSSYYNGSTSPAPTFQDQALTIANTNPLELDAAGACVLWLDSSIVYKFVLRDASGVVQWTQNDITGAGSLAASLSTDFSAGSGAGRVGFNGALNYAAQTIGAELANFPSMTSFSGYDPSGVTDMASLIQSAANFSKNLRIVGTPKISTAITLTSGANITGGQQQSTAILCFGCDGFVINGAFGDNIKVANLELRGYTAAGLIDARTHSAIKCLGTNDNHVNYFKGDNLYLRGWQFCVDWQYTWNSVLNDITTINCDNGVRLFGQSVNNSISNSRLGANGGDASILTAKDGATKGEGLMVSNCLLASGDYGIKSDGWLSLSVANSTIDLIQLNAFDFTNVAAFTLMGSWVYAEKIGVNYNPLSVLVEQGGCITGSYITTAATGGKAVYFGALNAGLSITGCALTSGTNSRLVHVDGAGVVVTGCRGVNTGANPSVYINGPDCTVRSNTGSMAVQWNVNVPSQGGMAVATAAFPGATGTATKTLFCGVVRNSVGNYSINFDQPLASANYMPLVTLDRGGNGAVGYSVVTQTNAGFQFTCTNQAGTLQDPVAVWLAVFN